MRIANPCDVSGAMRMLDATGKLPMEGMLNDFLELVSHLSNFVHISVVDPHPAPGPAGSVYFWLSRIRIRIRVSNTDSDTEALKLITF